MPRRLSNYLERGCKDPSRLEDTRDRDAIDTIAQTDQKNLMRYLVGIKALGLTLGSACDPKDLKLRVYADASFANDLYTRCSTASHVVFIGLGPVH
ncbi:hypothetical protein L249_0924 [Ophiocordyceps polyrhachis-furcata BCC 54312]|uniref:Uncharacterized protein n=1 Tax=Ophiocordyceps polyrhachis-furcata BCC 54312 TaxID=1330021 RepID=A0A367LCX7_9HYPO|nr:hypothetical protein L249_0924 [Ophiocordyceps polyrhachis-furcata BCC 54312]